VGTKPSTTKGSATRARKSPKHLDRLTVEYLPITKIKPYDRNPRRNRPAVQKTAASLKEFGWRQPIVVDRDMVIVVGHTRYMAAQLLGQYTVPVHIARNLTPEQAKAYRIADNRTGEEAEWNEDQLGLELQELMQAGVDLTLSAMDPEELDRLLKVAAKLEATDGSDATIEPELPEPTTKPGDLWILGKHRLLCGDATVYDDVARLMNGERADLANTDPPYGVDYSSLHLRAIDGDDRTQDDLVALLTPAFRNLCSFTTNEAAFYIWHGGGKRRRDFEFAMDAVGIEEKQTINWIKEHFVMGRADYHWQTEPCFYGQKRGQRAKFYGDRKQSSVWRLSLTRRDHSREILIETGLQIGDGHGNNIYVARIVPRNKKPPHLRITDGQTLIISDGSAQSDAWLVMRDQDKYEHPTQKPTGLATRAIENSTIPGQIVLDTFAGGGFTLLGAEETGRVARAMELSPRWCDVIVSRWAKQTGKEPRRA
jgi:DNA modification methylase